ncbi:MAG: hypothetical protein QM783_20015 [Phycisphaerales bacterium]
MVSFARRCAVAALMFVSLFSICRPAAASPPPWPSWPFPPAAPAVPQARRGINPPTEFGIYLNLTCDTVPWYTFSFGGAPLRMDCLLIPAGEPGGLYPRQGPHMIELYPGGRAAYYTAYLTALTNLINLWLPTTNYDGLLVCDYEFFSPWYTGHLNYASTQAYNALDNDPIDDWRDTLRVTRASAIAGMTAAQQEAYFKQEWESTTREFFERTYNLLKQLRPNSKVGFYNQPAQCYWEWRDPVKAAAMRQGHDEVTWFWNMVDIILPSTYTFYQSVPDHRVPGPSQDRESDFDAYCRANIGEALRVARGKPVYNYVAFQHHASNPLYANDPVNYYNLRHPFEVARELGCNGCIIWGWVRTQHQYDQCVSYVPSTLVPFVTRFANLPTYAPANPGRPQRIQ